VPVGPQSCPQCRRLFAVVWDHALIDPATASVAGNSKSPHVKGESHAVLRTSTADSNYGSADRHLFDHPSLYERLKPFAEQGGVSHQASVLPNMQLVAGRFEIEADTRSRNEIDSDLMRGARRGPGNGAAKVPIDRAVQVTAQDAFDLRMAPNHLGKSGGIIKAVIVHIGDTRREGRMMHHDDSWTLGLRGERCVEPGELSIHGNYFCDKWVPGCDPKRASVLIRAASISSSLP
jgi:hypothetical protein